MSAERLRNIGSSSSVEVYQHCSTCQADPVLRLSTLQIEHIRRALARAVYRRDNGGRGYAGLENHIKSLEDNLKREAIRSGLADQVPELCQPLSQNH